MAWVEVRIGKHKRTHKTRWMARNPTAPIDWATPYMRICIVHWITPFTPDSTVKRADVRQRLVATRTVRTLYDSDLT